MTTKKTSLAAAALVAACATAACGKPSEERVPAEPAVAPAVSGGAAGDTGPGRQMPGPLLDVPAAPAPGPALLGGSANGDASATPAPRIDPVRGTRDAAGAERPRIVLGDDAGPDLGAVILENDLALERLELPAETVTAAERGVPVGSPLEMPAAELAPPAGNVPE